VAPPWRDTDLVVSLVVEKGKRQANFRSRMNHPKIIGYRMFVFPVFFEVFKKDGLC
jgi:hypothetical protein